MKEIECITYKHHKEWIVNTKTRWCGFVIQKSYYDEGVVLEEFDEDGERLCGYVLKDFPKKSIPYFNQEKDQIVIITLNEEK